MKEILLNRHEGFPLEQDTLAFMDEKHTELITCLLDHLGMDKSKNYILSRGGGEDGGSFEINPRGGGWVFIEGAPIRLSGSRKASYKDKIKIVKESTSLAFADGAEREAYRDKYAVFDEKEGIPLRDFILIDNIFKGTLFFGGIYDIGKKLLSLKEGKGELVFDNHFNIEKLKVSIEDKSKNIAKFTVSLKESQQKALFKPFDRPYHEVKLYYPLNKEGKSIEKRLQGFRSYEFNFSLLSEKDTQIARELEGTDLYIIGHAAYGGSFFNR